MKKKKTEKYSLFEEIKTEKCSLFEEMLMWTSYRYCIGRHTYVTSLAGEMAQHYYDKLDDERMEFTANDIRREIMDKLQWLPCKFTIHRMYEADQFNPIDAFMTFLEKNDVKTMDEFLTFAEIDYDAHTDTYLFSNKTPTIKSYFSISDIEDLLPWENLAACFDKKNYKMVTTEYNGETKTFKCFKTWVRKSVPCEDKPGYYRVVEFGWEPRWVVVDDYLTTGSTYKTLNEEHITKIEDAIQ